MIKLVIIVSMVMKIYSLETASLCLFTLTEVWHPSCSIPPETRQANHNHLPKIGRVCYCESELFTGPKMETSDNAASAGIHKGVE